MEKIMKEKILVMGDIHIYPHKNYNYFCLLAQQIFEYIHLYCVQNKITSFVFLGDLFENRNSIEVENAIKVKNILKKMRADKINISAIVGNHDMVFSEAKEVDVNSLALYESYFHNFQNKKSIFEIKNLINNDNFEFYGLNYTNYSSEMILKKMPVLNPNKKSILFTHNDIMGIKLANNTEMLNGFNPSIFANFYKVFNGHIHLQSEYKNIVQVGSPYKYSLSELNTPSGFYVLNFEEENFSYEFVQIDFLPKLYTLKIQEAREDYFKEELDKFNLSNDFVLLEVETNDINYVSELKKFITNSYEVVDVYIDVVVDVNNSSVKKDKDNKFLESYQKTQEIIKNLQSPNGFFSSFEKFLKEEKKMNEQEIEKKIALLKNLIKEIV